MKRVAYIFSALCLLQLGGGSSADQPSQPAGMAATAQERAEYNSTVVDTVYSDFPYLKCVYNWRPGKVAEPSVPFVDLDTNTYEKKLWLSKKQFLSLPIESKRARIVALDSVVYVAYSSSEGTWYLYSTFSLTYGHTWSSPYFIQETGGGMGKCLLIDDQRVFLAYSTAFSQDFLREILFRKTDTAFSMLSDSVIIDVTSSSLRSLSGPDLVWWNDTLFLSYFHYHNSANHFRFTKSNDQGESWGMISGDVVTAAGIPHFFLLTDTVLSEVCRSGSVEIRIHRSFDGGLT